jgi:hypothetical protein
MASPTVEPDPDNAGGGKLLIQAARSRSGLFCSKGSKVQDKFSKWHTVQGTRLKAKDEV